jgi:hypothetical protein
MPHGTLPGRLVDAPEPSVEERPEPDAQSPVPNNPDDTGVRLIKPAEAPATAADATSPLETDSRGTAAAEPSAGGEFVAGISSQAPDGTPDGPAARKMTSGDAVANVDATIRCALRMVCRAGASHRADPMDACWPSAGVGAQYQRDCASASTISPLRRLRLRRLQSCIRRAFAFIGSGPQVHGTAHWESPLK